MKYALAALMITVSAGAVLAEGREAPGSSAVPKGTSEVVPTAGRWVGAKKHKRRQVVHFATRNVSSGYRIPTIVGIAY